MPQDDFMLSSGLDMHSPTCLSISWECVEVLNCIERGNILMEGQRMWNSLTDFSDRNIEKLSVPHTGCNKIFILKTQKSVDNWGFIC